MPEKIIGYKIISSTNSNPLVADVENLIDKGWTPYGSLCADTCKMFQAMVLYKREDDEAYCGNCQKYRDKEKCCYKEENGRCGNWTRLV